MKNVLITIIGTTLDRRGKGDKRWDKWRPTISICQQEDLLIHRMELLADTHAQKLAHEVIEDIELVSPETQVNLHTVKFEDPWDFERVYSSLHDFANNYKFKPEKERYLVHITTGTHVAQICWYLLTESHYIPGHLLQTSPPPRGKKSPGQYQIIDLDLSKYDQIASRFNKEHKEGTEFLKSGIETKNSAFNKMIEQLEKVSLRSSEPILITGPTGAGKSQLASRVYELKKHKGLIQGSLVAVNCATLKGENAMSTLFGHKKGAFTGAMQDRKGLLREADGGILFLDEIGELGADEQAMLLKAIETKSFMPFGADKEVSSDFQLIAGTNRNLNEQSQQGKFREDLLARIDLWTYQLPSLVERKEDIPANIEFEIDRFSKKAGYHVSFNNTAKTKYLKFSQSNEAIWKANFRDLNASITRMATLCDGGRITTPIVNEEILRLQQKWHSGEQASIPNLAKHFVKEEIDFYEQAQLSAVVSACQQSQSMAEAGRRLFQVSRQQKTSVNDSHRVKQILSKYDLTFEQIKEEI